MANPEPGPVIYLITVNYNSADWIARLLASLQSETEPYRLIVVNNSPADLQVTRLSSPALTHLEAGDNLGFGGGCNLGLQWVYQQDPRAIVWLINPDATLPAGMVQQCRAFWQAHPNDAIVGTSITEPSGKVWFAGGWFNCKTGAIWMATEAPEPEATYLPCDWVSGCSLMLNLACFVTCPQFDPAYFLYYEDFDFCRRYASQGYSVGWATRLQVIHTPSAITDRNQRLKLQHSTYSYLLTLERYTNGLIAPLRLLRILTVALLLFPLQREAALGKWTGILLYLRRVVQREFPLSG